MNEKKGFRIFLITAVLLIVIFVSFAVGGCFCNYEPSPNLRNGYHVENIDALEELIYSNSGTELLYPNMENFKEGWWGLRVDYYAHPWTNAEDISSNSFAAYRLDITSSLLQPPALVLMNIAEIDFHTMRTNLPEIFRKKGSLGPVIISPSVRIYSMTETMYNDDYFLLNSYTEGYGISIKENYNKNPIQATETVLYLLYENNEIGGINTETYIHIKYGLINSNNVHRGELSSFSRFEKDNHYYLLQTDFLPCEFEDGGLSYNQEDYAELKSFASALQNFLLRTIIE